MKSMIHECSGLFLSYNSPTKREYSSYLVYKLMMEFSRNDHQPTDQPTNQPTRQVHEMLSHLKRCVKIQKHYYIFCFSAESIVLGFRAFQNGLRNHKVRHNTQIILIINIYYLHTCDDGQFTGALSICGFQEKNRFLSCTNVN